ncbi:MAG: transglycosylase domain-containing protein, partial [Parvularculaceae bacterium]|nr:transglycosylase domain-containing protein [Parvularculaceae bacterium]
MSEVEPKSNPKPAVRRRRRKKASARAPYWHAALGVAAALGAGIMAAAALASIAVVYYAHDLPSRDDLWREARPKRVTLLAADGSPMPVGGESLGMPVRLADLPPHVPNAVLAVEDRTFRHHIGVNP